MASQEDMGHQEDFSYDVKIPQERTAILIGKEGATKKHIEQESHCLLDITAEGNVTVSGSDAIALYSTREIVRAIGRGFNPSIALQLLKTDFVLEIIRLKGRIIGQAGKARAQLEEFTETSISVYGKTVSIIGEAMAVTLAHQAVSMLIGGAMHKTVFKFLEKRRKENELADGIVRAEGKHD
jgi:ribosomal RNA assembly protein